MRPLALLTVLLVLSLCSASAQQIVNDPDVNTNVLHSAFPQNSGPVVAVDSSHNNYHTIEGRYEPLAAVLRNDGFRVVDSTSAFTSSSLSSFKVLVISNALSPGEAKNWNLPASSAFSKAEIKSLKAWVVAAGRCCL